MLGTTLCPLLLAMLGSMLASGPDSQSSSVQIIFPEKFEENKSSEEKISYIIPINQKPYIVYLQKRGILQFENVSYGIEPLESTIPLQHIIYKLGDVENDLTVFNKNSRNIEMPTDYSVFINEKSESPLKLSFPLYLEMSIVVDKALYDYLGSDSMIVTNKIIETISLINSVFSQLKVTIVLSSLELWSDKNRIPTVGEADELLRQFLEWKQSYLTLRPHDVAYLFIYNEYPNYVGATYPGKMCASSYSAGITMYPKGMTLEAFSIVVTQMLGLSLGISYDDPTKCNCSEAVCVMNPRAMQSPGTKVFSNCSLNDFEHFKSNVGAKCLQNKPQMQNSPRAICGNGKVEGNEVCDCGSQQQCGPDSCCEPTTCVLKDKKDCDSLSPSQSCCHSCSFLPANHKCRPSKHPICDVPEVCNGSSGFCPPDVKIHDGRTCRDGSRNAPFSCYEEIQSQTDRFGNCGKDKQNKYIFCGWRNLICGRLICTYPSRIPYNPPNISTASVIYAFVRDQVCISVDYGSNVKDDPLKVISGSVCDQDRICLNNICSETRFLKDKFSICTNKCNGRGMDNVFPRSQELLNDNPTIRYATRLVNVIVIRVSNLQTVHQGADLPCGLPSKANLIMQGLPKNTEKKWLLSLYIALIILTSTLLVITAWKGLKHWFFKEDESLSSETKSEDNTQTSSK
ncbi:disintegrin and metalloproteinase domain-containing protein 32 [Cricetulus griseus]|nr:disintegrin and metalloproteinase domain-containing protein 32 [Cricetulus griseus]